LRRSLWVSPFIVTIVGPKAHGIEAEDAALISQIRSFLLEYGVVIASDVAAFKRDLPHKLTDNSHCISPRLQLLIGRLREELQQLVARARAAAAFDRRKGYATEHQQTG
jgi:hypothetical protein